MLIFRSLLRLWGDGMASVSVFPCGGGAKLKVTVYSAVGNLPASAKEGAVAVITSTAIGDVYVSADEPASPASGDLWAWIGGQSAAPVDLTDLFTVHPRAIYQYSGSAWALLESYVYTSSAWVEVTLYLYDNGEFLLSSGATEVYSYGTYNVFTIGELSLYIYAYHGGSHCIETIGFDTPIDLTDVSQIKIYCSIISLVQGNNGAGFKLGISPDKSRSLSAAVYRTTNATGLTMTLDVSAYSGLYYVMLEAYGNDSGAKAYAYVQKAWLVR